MLSTKEVLLIAALLSFVMFLVLYSARHNRIDGIGELLLANVFGLCAYLLYAFGRELPPLPAYEGANALYASAAAATVIGYRKLFNRNAAVWQAYSAVVVLVTLIAVFHYWYPSFAARTIVVSIFQAGAAGTIFWTVYGARNEWPSSRYPLYFIIAMCTFIAGGHAFRALRQLLDTHAPTSLLEPTGLNLFFLSAGAFALPVLTLGGLLVAHCALLSAAEYAANRDFLTGARTRRALFDGAERELARAMRAKVSLCVMLVDLDHLKTINDKLGHFAGDRALTTLTRVAMKCLRSVDDFGRIGGDEFAAVIPDTDLDDAIKAATRLKNEFYNFPHQCQGIRPSVSIGISKFRPGDSLGTLLERADTALYRAKDAGRNCVMTEEDIVERVALQS
ncbi:sensor domain-containing diguanylate cyclase [Noviherbaspirillum denitrificans]|uniref:diguanylate cyclase n=1 Tax=Noviherbaspirillum denitrificans TaxID=1968433 RepID=A0A254TGA3_9BURK|nr:GGDEF domain-containing protein [Noviherbaspirillum denitrificans]OWW19563.1 hypothetical protein AYR66_08580 [Noviherbaspirillum denitrificans]